MSFRRFFVGAWFLACLLTTGAMGETRAIVSPNADPLPRGALLRMGSSRLLHSTWLSSVRFSADDRWVGTADSNGVVRLWEVATGKLTWEKPKGTGRKLALSPDGKTLLSGCEDTTMLLWDVSGAGRTFIQLTPKQLGDYWDALADADADISAGAQKILLSAPRQAVDLFEQRLTAGEVHDAVELPKLIAELCGDDVKANLKSAVRLRAFGVRASPALFKALAEKPPLAARRRIEDVLESIGKFPIPPDALQRTRAIQLLEQIGSEDAEAILKKLAETNPPTPSSQGAEAALRRLKQRSRAPKAKLVPVK